LNYQVRKIENQSMQLSYIDRYTRAFKYLREEFKAILGFEIWFSLIYFLAFAPFTAWFLDRLLATSGQLAVSNEDIATFFLSPSGILFIYLNLIFFIGLTYFEQVGLMLISMTAVYDRVISVSNVLRQNLSNIVSIIRLGLFQAVLYVAASLPFLAAGYLTYISFLGDHDINFYLTAKPWHWWAALVIVGIFGVLNLVVVACLFVRMLFAVPILIFENTGPVEALKQSWRRTRSRILELGMPLAVWFLFILLASIVSTWIFKTVFGFVLSYAGLTLAMVLPLVIFALAVIVLTDLFLFILGKAVLMFLIVDFYREAANGKINVKVHEEVQVQKKISPSALRKAGWAAVCFALVTSIIGAAVFLEKLDLDRRIAVTAHRGSSREAPENTMSALHQAVKDGADYAEIDVQTTSDGVVVMIHDADLMRLASINQKVADISYEELRRIDIGSWFSEAFSNQRTATLEEAVRFADERIRLNIELKYNRPDPSLVTKVGNIVRTNSFSDKCVVTSLDYGELQKFKKIFPEIRTGLIVFRALGRVLRTEADFLSIHAAMATSGLVRRAHREGKEIHVWTVNDLQTALSIIEVGVDNIITDKPAFIGDVLQAWNDLSDTEKIALWLRNLIVDLDPELVGEL
jgi:glycerophosphoryl diester phosphodiesterase